MVRYSYEPKQAGIIVIADVWHARLGYIDCRAGGAQQTFADLCEAFARAGWELEKRVFDRRYMRRGWTRWEIDIRDPESLRPRDERGFMSALVDQYREQGTQPGDHPNR